nr:roadblock/LC7 domain-containing protein [Actinospica durhamensis]
MNRLRPELDWMLEDLVATVPGTRQVMVLSGDGLRMAHRGADVEFADRLAAACAGVQSLSAAIAQMHPGESREVRLVVVESANGFFFLMAAGPGAYLAALADAGVDAGLMGQQMRDLVARLGDHLATGPRAPEPEPA